MKRSAPRLLIDETGAAAAEMALVTPLLLIIMFGALETGKFFWDEHIVVKAVRDGARFAGRQKFADMECDETPTNEAAIKNQTRLGTPVSTGTDKPLLSYWTSADTITVTVACRDNSESESGTRTYAGLYSERDEVPYVTVTATVPYEPLVSAIGVDLSGLSVTATNQAPVVGI